MAWRTGTAPGGLPLSGDQMESMAFAYIHNSATGLQRSLWNCFQTPRGNKDECMLQRNPRAAVPAPPAAAPRSEEHTSELQSLMRISYAVFCLQKKTHSKPKQ